MSDKFLFDKIEALEREVKYLKEKISEALEREVKYLKEKISSQESEIINLKQFTPVKCKCG
jgi:hypothetical protein